MGNDTSDSRQDTDSSNSDDQFGKIARRMARAYAEDDPGSLSEYWDDARYYEEDAPANTST